MLPILRTAFIQHGSSVVARIARPRSHTRRPYATTTQQSTGYGSELPWIVGSIAFTVPAVAYLLSGDSTTHHSSTHTGQHVHRESSPDESTKQQSSDAGSKASVEVPEDTKPEQAEETSAGDNEEGGPQSPPETITDQEEPSKYDNAKDELSEEAKKTGIKVTEKATEVKENVKDKILPDSAEVPEATNHPHPDPVIEEGTGPVSTESGRMNIQSGKQKPESFDDRGEK